MGILGLLARLLQVWFVSRTHLTVENLAVPSKNSVQFVTTFCTFLYEFSASYGCGGRASNNPRHRNASLAWLPCVSLRLTTLVARRRMDRPQVSQGWIGSDALVAIQLGIAVSGSHVGHELFRLTFIRA